MGKKRWLELILTLVTFGLLILWQIKEFLDGKKAAFFFIIIFVIMIIDQLYKIISDEAYAEEIEKNKKTDEIYAEMFGKFTWAGKYGFFIFLLAALLLVLFFVTKITALIALALIAIAIIYQTCINHIVRKKLKLKASASTDDSNN